MDNGNHAEDETLQLKLKLNLVMHDLTHILAAPLISQEEVRRMLVETLEMIHPDVRLQMPAIIK